MRTHMFESNVTSSFIAEASGKTILSGWIVALSPIIGGVILYLLATQLHWGLSGGQIFVFWVALNTVACFWDNANLEEDGFDTSHFSGAWMILCCIVPLYLYRRRKMTPSMVLLMVWIVATFISLLIVTRAEPTPPVTATALSETPAPAVVVKKDNSLKNALDDLRVITDAAAEESRINADGLRALNEIKKAAAEAMVSRQKEYEDQQKKDAENGDAIN